MSCSVTTMHGRFERWQARRAVTRGTCLCTHIFSPVMIWCVGCGLENSDLMKRLEPYLQRARQAIRRRQPGQTSWPPQIWNIGFHCGAESKERHSSMPDQV